MAVLRQNKSLQLQTGQVSGVPPGTEMAQIATAAVTLWVLAATEETSVLVLNADQKPVAV